MFENDDIDFYQEENNSTNKYKTAEVLVIMKSERKSSK
jgi:hypothetical protein